MRVARVVLSLLSIGWLLPVMFTNSHAQLDTGPISKEALLRILVKGLHRDDLGFLIQQIQRRGVDFQLTSVDEQEFRESGKNVDRKGFDKLLTAIRQYYRIPDVVLRFVHQKSPALVIVNLSDVVVRDIKWTVVLWNTNLPDRDAPLPIPITSFDWIRGHNESGPQNLFGSPLIDPLLKPGNRLLGTASVVCPECIRGRTYFVYIIWGEGGWFSEIDEEKDGYLIVPPNFLRETREAYYKVIEGIPEKSRIPIGESGQQSPLSTPIPASAKPTSTPPPMQAPEQLDFPVAKINWVSEPVSSPREDFPFAVRVTIQSTAPISPVHFVVECSGPIAPAAVQPLPSGISFGVQQATRGGTYDFRMENPPLTPQQPVILWVLSVTRIKVSSVKRVVNEALRCLI